MKLDFWYWKIFGYVAFVHVRQHQRGKLDPRTLKCVIVGSFSTQRKNATIRSLKKYMYLQMFPLLKMSHTLANLIFRESLNQKIKTCSFSLYLTLYITDKWSSLITSTHKMTPLHYFKTQKMTQHRWLYITQEFLQCTQEVRIWIPNRSIFKYQSQVLKMKYFWESLAL